MSRVTPRTHFGLHFHIWDSRTSNMRLVIAVWPYGRLLSWWSGGPGSLPPLVWLCHAHRQGVRFRMWCRKTHTVLRRPPKGPLIRRSSPRAHRNWSQNQKIQSRSPPSAIWLACALWVSRGVGLKMGPRDHGHMATWVSVWTNQAHSCHQWGPNDVP